GPHRRRHAHLAVPNFIPVSTVIDSLERSQLRRVPAFDAGDRLRVHFQVIEGTRRRTQVFEGVVIKRQGHGARETFTVRKQSFGVGVERSFPLHSPKIERVEIAARGDVRRAKLYYLRGRVGKRARVRERRYVGPEEAVEPGLLEEPAAATDAEGLTAEEAVMQEAAADDQAAATADGSAATDETAAPEQDVAEAQVSEAPEGAQEAAPGQESEGEAEAAGEAEGEAEAEATGEAEGEDSSSDADAAEPEGRAGDEPA